VPLKELELWLKRGQTVPILRETCSPQKCTPKIGANIGAITGILLSLDTCQEFFLMSLLYSNFGAKYCLTNLPEVAIREATSAFRHISDLQEHQELIHRFMILWSRLVLTLTLLYPSRSIDVLQQ
jgi:hypothetical protein